jgi:hypothetical protein
VEEEEIR